MSEETGHISLLVCGHKQRGRSSPQCRGPRTHSRECPVSQEETPEHRHALLPHVTSASPFVKSMSPAPTPSGAVSIKHSDVVKSHGNAEHRGLLPLILLYSPLEADGQGTAGQQPLRWHPAALSSWLASWMGWELGLESWGCPELKLKTDSHSSSCPGELT